MGKIIIMILLVMSLSACTTTKEDFEYFTVSFESNISYEVEDIIVKSGDTIEVPHVVVPNSPPCSCSQRTYTIGLVFKL